MDAESGGRVRKGCQKGREEKSRGIDVNRDAHARGLGESKCKEARININSSDQ